jgi:hypothetical protein
MVVIWARVAILEEGYQVMWSTSHGGDITADVIFELGFWLIGWVDSNVKTKINYIDFILFPYVKIDRGLVFDEEGRDCWLLANSAKRHGRLDPMKDGVKGPTFLK